MCLRAWCLSSVLLHNKLLMYSTSTMQICACLRVCVWMYTGQSTVGSYYLRSLWRHFVFAESSLVAWVDRDLSMGLPSLGRLQRHYVAYGDIRQFSEVHSLNNVCQNIIRTHPDSSRIGKNVPDSTRECWYHQVSRMPRLLT